MTFQSLLFEAKQKTNTDNRHYNDADCNPLNREMVNYRKLNGF